MSVSKRYSVSGYDEFKQKITELESTGDVVNVHFTGSKDDSGSSWCSDCNDAKPHIEKAVVDFLDESHYLYVEVGGRAFWKDMKNPFRLDKNVHISVIPSLIRWKQPQRLEGEQCCNAELLEMFFTDE